MSTHEHTQDAFLITVAQPDPDEGEAMARYAEGSFAVAGEYGAELVTRLQVREQINGDTPAAIIGIARFPSAEAIRAHFAYWDDIAVIHDGHRSVSSGHGFCGIGRMRLLLLLQERARELGVELRFETEVASAAMASSTHSIDVKRVGSDVIFQGQARAGIGKPTNETRLKG